MEVNWSMLLTIFLAIVLARIFNRALFSGGSKQEGTHVGAKTQSPTVPTVTYANPIDQFIAEHHPNARR